MLELVASLFLSLVFVAFAVGALSVNIKEHEEMKDD